MSVWALLWQLVVHVLHGRGRDAVYLVVSLPGDTEPASSLLESFRWESDKDAFCLLEGADRGSGTD